MAQHRITPPGLRPGQESNAQASDSPALLSARKSNLHTGEATAPAEPPALALAIPRLCEAACENRTAKTQPAFRARSQTGTLSRPPSDTRAQPHFGFASKTHRVLH